MTLDLFPLARLSRWLARRVHTFRVVPLKILGAVNGFREFRLTRAADNPR